MASKTQSDRQLLTSAQGPLGKLAAFLRLSGPGWLQSAITLGGGSLGGALYLGVLGGSQMLWLQLVAIVIGVIMLSAIAYVTLSTNIRPYHAINQHVNPVLGIGWISATILANMIWILPQFALCFDTLNQNLLPGMVSDTRESKILVSAILGTLALTVVVMSFNAGWMSKMFDWLLKLMVGMIVVCFVGVIIYLTGQNELNFAEIWQGFIPRLSHWNNPAPEIAGLLQGLPEQWHDFWRERIVSNQQAVIIGTTATAVGVNMTFLLPYSMLARGWDKPFRGLARFDLVTAMAIPFIVVTSCIVLASANAFHARADARFLSSEVDQIRSSRMFTGALDVLEERLLDEQGDQAMDAIHAMPGDLADEKKAREEAREQKLAEFALTLPVEERKLAATLVKPNTSQLAQSLEPLLGEKNANGVFGLGAFAMGFSTIVILMLINGYAFAEVLGGYNNRAFRSLGALLAAATGFCWFFMWVGQSKTWLIIVASTFAAILLPIAYIAFFLLMNNRQLLGDEKPRGLRMSLWNIAMLAGVTGAIAQAVLATSLQIRKPGAGGIVIGAVTTFLVLAVVGFSARRTTNTSSRSPNTDE